ncbi:MAG: hypothetical protein ACFFG0_48640 [Candidatus Thorarchaeota archaeon]
MTLKKLITGKPGNIREFLDIAERNKSSVGVVLIAYEDQDWLNIPSIEGKVAYSCMGKDSEGKPKKYRLTLYPNSLGGFFFGPKTGKEMIKALYANQKKNLSLLDNQNINYRIRNLNIWDKIYDQESL